METHKDISPVYKRELTHLYTKCAPLKSFKFLFQKYSLTNDFARVDLLKKQFDS